MFERNRIDNTRDVIAVAVKVALTDGAELVGKLVISRSRDLQETLNGGDPFVAFEPYGETRMILAKSSIQSVRPIDAAQVPNLTAPITDGDGFDPHTVLGVARRADWDEIRAAFHKLSMVYHPDRYATAHLPADVSAYLDAKARQINTAYAVLEDAHYRPVGTAKPTAEPVFQKSAR
ncbi:MAG: J domain-containing protein [Pseudomonadota bacterium]